jgi:hypothetical protein
MCILMYIVMCFFLNKEVHLSVSELYIVLKYLLMMCALFVTNSSLLIQSLFGY